MITVGELIDMLSEYSDDYPVMIGYTRLKNVYLDDSFYFGDSKNPAQAIGPAVILE